MLAPLADLIADFAAGRASAAAICDEALERAGTLGAYVEVGGERARRQARAADAVRLAGVTLGPLQGVPVSVKDLYGVTGYRTRAGSPRPLPSRWEREGALVGRLRRQLGVVIGKTHTVEFAFGGLGTNAHWPIPRNPWDPQRVPGGSSSGAGVSLWEGSAILALGTDTAGSVRIPASFTGTVGLKTTRGRWPTDGIVPLSPTLDTPGILGRTAADVEIAFWALDADAPRPAPQDPPGPAAVVLGVSEDLFWDDTSPGVAEAVRDAIDEVIHHGFRVVACPLPEARDAYELFLEGGPVGVECLSFLRAELPDRIDDLDPVVRDRIETCDRLPAIAYLDRLRRMERLSRRAGERLAGIDALLTPTVAVTPPRLSDVADADGYRRQNLLALRNTGVVNYLGLCAATIPIGRDRAGMPVGMQLIGRAGGDARVIAVARALEEALGTAARRLGSPPGLEAGGV